MVNIDKVLGNLLVKNKSNVSEGNVVNNALNKILSGSKVNSEKSIVNNSLNKIMSSKRVDFNFMPSKIGYDFRSRNAVLAGSGGRVSTSSTTARYIGGSGPSKTVTKSASSSSGSGGGGGGAAKLVDKKETSETATSPKTGISTTVTRDETGKITGITTTPPVTPSAPGTRLPSGGYLSPGTAIVPNKVPSPPKQVYKKSGGGGGGSGKVQIPTVPPGGFEKITAPDLTPLPPKTEIPTAQPLQKNLYEGFGKRFDKPDVGYRLGRLETGGQGPTEVKGGYFDWLKKRAKQV